MEVQVRFAPAPTHISNTRDRLYRRRGAGRRSAIGDNGWQLLLAGLGPSI